ncbi:MAG: amidohydrolase [Maricaulaceae bacterium]
MRHFNLTRRAALSTVFISIFALAGCSSSDTPETTTPTTDTSQRADVIFTGEHIITMDDTTPNAVAIAGGKILATGSAAEIAKLAGPETRNVELGERALLPGFIDAHGHATASARFIDLANLSSPPVGPVETIADLQDALRKHIAANDFSAGDWIIGYGYDESLLAENRHPTRDDLDAVSTEHNIVILHVSIHLAAANSMSLETAKITAESPDPAGGVIRRRAGTTEPNGVLEETAAHPLLFQLVIGGTGLADQLPRTLIEYASYGITTAQDGAASMNDVAAIQAMTEADVLPIDLVSYPHTSQIPPSQLAALEAGEYKNGFRIGGVKFVLDGSIQGKTGFLGEPYKESLEGLGDDYLGYPMVPPAKYEADIAPLIARGLPLLIHANGDGAIDMMLEGLDKALDGTDITDHRTTIIHAQMIREDQILRAKELGALPSFFSAHPFYWGDWHRQILGEERASRISPIRSTINQGVPFTIHNDSPVVPPHMMRLIDVTVNRKTRSGYVLGPDQRATVMEALHAVTLGAAYQFFEEDTKGSITVGKQADLVILGENPLTAPKEQLQHIEIIETFARGKSVFKAK